MSEANYVSVRKEWEELIFTYNMHANIIPYGIKGIWHAIKLAFTKRNLIGVDFKLKIKGEATLCDIQITEKLENDKT